MDRRKSSAGALCAVLVIVAMIAGIFIGILIGRTMGSGSSSENKAEQSSSIEGGESGGQTEGQPAETGAADTVTDTGSEAPESGSEDEQNAVVMSINGRELTMEEINYYLYRQRDYYVDLYDEEPWDMVMENGQTVSEYAKQQMYDDIVRIQILVGQAANYGVEMTDEMRAQLADSAQEYVDKLGPEICAQFGLNASAIAQVYQDGELSNAVYNTVLDQLRTQMREDSNYSSLSDEEFENAVNDAYNALFEEWKASADIQTTAIWDTIVVGSVG